MNDISSNDSIEVNKNDKKPPPAAAKAAATAVTSSNDDDKNNNDETLFPHGLLPGISIEDLNTTARVLNGIAMLNPKNQKKNQKQNNNNNTKKRKQQEQEEEKNGHDNIQPKNDQQRQDQHDDDDNVDTIAIYKHKLLRPLRKALADCLDLHQLSMYNGKTEQDYYQEKMNLRTLKRQKMSERDTQKKYIAGTELRRGRMQKLQQLQHCTNQKQEEEQKLKAMTMLMIPDGHVDTTTPTINTNNNNNKLLTAAAANSDDDDVINDTSDNITNHHQQHQQQHQDADKNDNDSNNEDPQTIKKKLPKLRSCYVCKVRYRDLHHFYDQLCPSCAALNWQKRHATADLKNKVAVVTGSRVKIGYQTCLKLLRNGATVVATSRFPNVTVSNFRKELDFDKWSHQLQVYGLDLRDVVGIEAFTRFLKQQYASCGIDILINNACQTIRRPSQYYKPMIEQEQELWKRADDTHQSLLQGCREFEKIRHVLQRQQNNGDNAALLSTSTTTATGQLRNNEASNAKPMLMNASTPLPVETTTTATTNVSTSSSTTTTTAVSTTTITTTTSIPTTSHFETSGISHSAAMSQMILLPEDGGISDDILPPGVTDINGQQLDLRTTNSWLLKMEQVSTPEVMECMFINAIAPFVLNSRLKPLMTTTPLSNNNNNRPDRYIINVSAMEGKFYRYKMANHPHTNMAKAALNMMTRTSAEELAKVHGIYMNSVDTGWINDENPLERANKTAKTNLFQTPIDEIDAASRILDPIFTGVNMDHEKQQQEQNDNQGNENTETKHVKKKDYGKFLKDYRETEW